MNPLSGFRPLRVAREEFGWRDQAEGQPAPCAVRRGKAEGLRLGELG